VRELGTFTLNRRSRQIGSTERYAKGRPREDPVLAAESGTRREVRMVVPASPEHLRAVRLVAADAAGRAGLDFDDTDDLRIAMDELAHWLIPYTSEPLRLDFSVGDGNVLVEGRACAVTTIPELDEFSEVILRSVANELEITRRDGEVRFAFVKRRGHA
jgi:hypothetical protein